jgi:hypothetical protein
LRPIAGCQFAICFDDHRQCFFEVTTSFGERLTLRVDARDFLDVGDEPLSPLFDHGGELMLHKLSLAEMAVSSMDCGICSTGGARARYTAGRLPALRVRLQGDVAVFFLGVGVALLGEGAEGGDDLGAGFGRFDDGVDVAALCGYEGIREAVAEFGDFFLA